MKTSVADHKGVFYTDELCLSGVCANLQNSLTEFCLCSASCCAVYLPSPKSLRYFISTYLYEAARAIDQNVNYVFRLVSLLKIL